jgi:CheY-like chemotaxis protein/anti-sigma regulatory factor (Ser/Thr protein kinase)
LNLTTDFNENQDSIVTRKVLVVDDSPVDRHLVGGLVNSQPGWQVFFSSNGSEALEFLKNSNPDVILTDLFMPDMDGVELVQTIRKDFSKIPIILMTAHGNEELAVRVLRAGAASYVPKKLLANELHATLNEVLSTLRNEKSIQIVNNSLVCHEVHFVLENDIAHVSPMVSHIEHLVGQFNFCEPNSMMLIGVALHEALTNAMLHGNLELDSKLRDDDEIYFYTLADERKNQKPYAGRKVMFGARISKEEIRFTIADEGPGFNPNGLPNPFEPENLDKVTGRGMLLIRTFMDHVEHNEHGNQITMVKKYKAS